MELRELKERTIIRLRERGFAIEEMADVLLETIAKDIQNQTSNGQMIDREQVIKRGQAIDREQAIKYISMAFENRAVLQSALVGINLDVLAEQGKLTEPYLSVIRSDLGTFAVDETLVEWSLSTWGKRNFALFDTIKSGVVQRADKDKLHCHTFADDVLGMFIAQGYKLYQKDLENTLDDKSVRSVEEFPIDDSLIYKNGIEQPPENEDFKKHNPANYRNDVLREAVKKELAPFEKELEGLAKISFGMQKKYIPTVMPRMVKKAQQKVLTSKTEVHAAILTAIELDRLYNKQLELDQRPSSERDSNQYYIFPELMDEIKNSPTFAPTINIAEGAAEFYGVVGRTNFGKLLRPEVQEQFPTLNSCIPSSENKSPFMSKMALMIVAGTNGKIASDFKRNTERWSKDILQPLQPIKTKYDQLRSTPPKNRQPIISNALDQGKKMIDKIITTRAKGSRMKPLEK